MKNIYIHVLIVFCFLSCKRKNVPFIPDHKIPIENNLSEKLDSIYASNTESIGIMVHIEYPNKNLSWSGAVGYSNKEKKTKIEINQPILIASNTKTFVAVTILRLSEENQLLLTATIDDYLSERTKSLLNNGGYDIKSIQIAHLLSHTSGINNYVDSPEFKDKIRSNPKYKWTREEQIELGVLKMNKLGNAGEKYKYSDTNYLLLCEIIEEVTKLKYYIAIRKLIDFKKHGLNETWFASLEDAPKGIIPLAHQYVGSWGVNSYKLDKSFDLYGGGGLASTSENLAVFFYKLFNKTIFNTPQTINSMLTKVKTEQKPDSDYRFGIWQSNLNGKTVYGHGGFWGSMVYYVPEMNMAISVIILEKDKSSLRKEIAEIFISELITQENH
jgi:D-alanyl-D-alanine carboxypeptidase